MSIRGHKTLLIPLEQAHGFSAESIGGKARNLALLQSFGFYVPRSWVLPSQLYSDILLESPVASDLGHHFPLPEEQTESLVDYFQSLPLPRPLEDELRKLEETSLAVRSSATCEDSRTASFAGVHSSFLGVEGVEQLWQAITDCYASLWTPRAQAYRRQMEFTHGQVQCAVLLCTMVEANCAGVAFTCEPRTGQRDCITINAGPGDAVVSGQCNPQSAFLSYQTGRLELVESGSPDYLKSPELLRLARLGIRIHWALGRGDGAQDIEWAYDGERFVFLQARPVTHLPRSTYAAIESRPIIWSNANLKDILPGVQSTMGWNLTQGSIRNIGLASVAAVGGEVPPGMEFTKRIHGRAYLDMTALQWALYDTFGLPPERTVKDMGSLAPSLRLAHGMLSGKAPRRLWRGIKLLARVLALYRHLTPAIDKLETLCVEAMTWELEPLSRPELLARLYQLRDGLFEFSELYQFVNIRASITLGALKAAYRFAAPGRSAQLISLALQGEGDMVSAKQGRDLCRLAELAGGESAVRAYLNDEHRDSRAWFELPEDSQFKAALEAYLEEFGHRAVYELKLENPRWKEDPGYILDQIAAMVDLPPSQRPRQPSTTLKALTPLNALARHALVTRERAKSALVWGIYPTRRVFLEIGKRLCEQSALQQPRDIFHWCWMDLECYLLDEWDGTGSLQMVESRQADINAWKELPSPPDFFILDFEGRSVDWNPDELHPASPPTVEGGLQGIGVSSGQARGIARILRTPRESKKLQSGEILVAPSTDPGWTPLFARASAVIMEVGGELSHGAIVAREFGIPAVVGIPGLLQTIEDGQEVWVDGDSGLVQPL